MEFVEAAESACNARDDKGGFLVAGGGGFHPKFSTSVTSQRLVKLYT